MKYKVALIILYDTEQRFLLQHRTADARLLPGHWAFFGGGLKDGETPEDALRREALEEIGHQVKSPKLILEQDFREEETVGRLYIFIEHFDADKSALRLNEGQGWGWFSVAESERLKMIDRDRQIIKTIARYLEDKIPEARNV